MEGMLSELRSDPIFLPSKFWNNINLINNDMLKNEGIENFKRTLAQNYYNWLVSGINDPQFRNVLKNWLCHPSLTPFLIKGEKTIRLQTMRHDKPTTIGGRHRIIYNIFVALLWDLACRLDRTNLSSWITEPKIGCPIQVVLGNRLISQDLANSIIEGNTLASLVGESRRRLRIAEIGAGYGRLAYVWSLMRPGTYVIFDIPPALATAQWYISRVFPGKKVLKFRPFESFLEIEGELGEADIAFFSANQIRKFPKNYFDVVLSISTLPEMTKDQVNLYLSLFQQLSREYIFLKQYKDHTNQFDKTRVRASDYQFGSDWSLIVDRTDPVQPKFFNRAWRKAA